MNRPRRETWTYVRTKPKTVKVKNGYLIRAEGFIRTDAPHGKTAKASYLILGGVLAAILQVVVFRATVGLGVSLIIMGGGLLALAGIAIANARYLPGLNRYHYYFVTGDGEVFERTADEDVMRKWRHSLSGNGLVRTFAMEWNAVPSTKSLGVIRQEIGKVRPEILLLVPE